MSWTRCIASMVLRLREGAPSTQQTLPSRPGGRAGFPALSGTQARLLTPRGAGWCVSPPLPPHRACVHCGRRAAPGCRRSCDVPAGGCGASGLCFPRMSRGDPGIVGRARVPPSVFPPSVFPRGQPQFRPHQQWCEGPAGLQPCQHLGSPVFSF